MIACRPSLFELHTSRKDIEGRQCPFTCFEALVGVCSAPGIGDVLVAVTQSLTASITIDCTLDPPVIRKHLANQLQLCGERDEV